MRILFQTYALAFQSPGGGERVILELQSALRARGHQVDLYRPWEHDPAAYDLTHYFSVLQSDSWRHCHQPLFVTPTLYIGRGWRDRFRILKERALSHVKALGKPDVFGNMQIPRAFFPATDYEAESLRSFYRIPNERIAVVPNGVSPGFLGAEGSVFRKFAKLDRPYVLHVGRFHPVKQQELLIRAMAGTDIDCVFIGARDSSHPEYLAHCEGEARNSQGKFHFLPALPADSEILASAYAGAAAFAFPSQFETFGLAALEAVIAGCPAVLSDGVVERAPFVGCASFLPPRDPLLWRGAILQAVQNPRRVDPEIRRRLAETYEWGAVARAIEDNYKRFLSI